MKVLYQTKSFSYLFPVNHNEIFYLKLVGGYQNKPHYVAFSLCLLFPRKGLIDVTLDMYSKFLEFSEGQQK